MSIEGSFKTERLLMFKLSTLKIVWHAKYAISSANKTNVLYKYEMLY